MHAPRIAFRSLLLPTAALLFLLVGLCLPHPGGISPTPPGGLWATLGGGGIARAQARRIDSPFNGDTPTRVSGAISSDTTWSARRSPYLVSSTVSVGGNANLVIEPGVEVRFARGASLNIGVGGAGGINAVGTAAKPVVFTSSAATKTAGSWGSVALSSHTKKTSRIAHARIEYAQTGLSLDGVPNGVSLRSSSIRNTSRQGIFIGRRGSAATLSSWSVSRSGSYALNAPRASSFGVRRSTLRGRVNAPRGVRAVWGPGNTLTDFGAWAACVPPNLVEAVAASVPKDGVLRVKGGTLSQSASWPARTYAILGVITVQGSTAPIMTLTAGTTLRFASGAGITVGETAAGGLVAAGTAAAPILFTADAAKPKAGAWQGLWLYGKTLATSRVEFCTLEYGRWGLYLWAIPAGVSLRDGTIRHTSWHGVEIKAGVASLERWTIAEAGSRYHSFFAGQWATHFVLNDSTIHGSTYAPHVTAFTLSNSTLHGGFHAWNAADAVLRNNTYHASAASRVHPNLVENVAVGTVGATAQTVLGVSGGTLRASASWPARKYTVSGNIEVEGTKAPSLRLAPGTTLHFARSAGLDVGEGAAGGLVAVGTAAAPILFTADVGGWWWGLRFFPKTLPTSRVEFCTLERGRWGLYLQGVPAGVRFRDGTIRHTSGHGVQIYAGIASLERWTIAEAGSGHHSFFAEPWAARFTLNDSTIHGATYASHVTSFSISNSTLRGGFYAPNAADAVLRNNTYHSSEVTRVHPNLVEDVAVGTVGATAQTVLGVGGGTLRESASWPARKYMIGGYIEVEGTAAPLLRLAPGTTLHFASSAGLDVGEGAAGGLVAVGTAAAPILFTADAKAPQAGAWWGLRFFRKTIATSRVEFCTLEYGKWGLYLWDVPVGVPFRDGTIRHTSGHGVEIKAGIASFERWTIAEPSSGHHSFLAGQWATFSLDRSTIHGAMYAPYATSFSISNSTLHGGFYAPGGADAVLRDNTYHTSTVTQVHPNLVENVAVGTVGATAQTVLRVSGGTLSKSTAWPARTFRVAGTVTVQHRSGPSLALTAGTTLRFASGAGLTVGEAAEGGLVAVGTTAAPILFTTDAAKPTAGAWQGIWFYGKTLATSRLEFSTVEYSQWGVWLHSVPAGVRFRDGTIRHTSGHGVEIKAGIASFERWTISSTAKHGVSSPTGSPQLSHLTITGAGGDGVHLGGFSGRVEHSTITTSAGDGVECIGSGRIELFDNRITGNTGRGLACAAAAHVERNTITGNGVGVELTAAPALLALHHNDLSGNTVPMKSTATAGADARWNWWGSATGPSDIVGQVRTDPWLGAAPTAPFRIGEAVASPASFAPGGSASTATVTAKTPQAATWSLVLRNGAGTTVRSFTGTGTSFSAAWDGANTTSQALPAGSYRYTLSAQSSAGGGTAAAPVVGDVTLVAGDLVAEIADPGPEARLRKAASLVVRGRALGTGFSAYELSYAAGADPASTAFTQIARGTTAVATAAALGTWNTSSLSEGIYTLRLRTRGADSATVEERVTVALLELGAVAIFPGLFSPNDDGRRDMVTASATATGRGAWTAQVRNAAGTVLRSYGGTGSRPRIVWDGRNTAGIMQSDGTYTVALRMAVAGAQPLESTGTLVLDTTAPQAVITAPAANATLLDYEQAVTGTASDTHFASYQLRTVTGEQTVAVLKKGTAAVTAGTLGTLTDGAIAPRYGDGPSYTLELFVEDRAGNRATTSRSLRFDRIHLTRVRVTPQTIDPEQDETVRIAYQLSRAATVTVQMVADRKGGPTLTLVENKSASPGSLTTTWNGKDAAGKPLARGLYHLRITARDTAGRSAVYDVAATPPSPIVPAWSQVQFNGQSTLDAAAFHPYRNDELHIDYQMSRPARHLVALWRTGQPQILLRDRVPVPAGANRVVWTGRLASGKPYTGPFTVYLGAPEALSELSLLIWSPAFRVEGFRANPYLLRPAHAQVVHLSYTLRRAAQVQIDVVDPAGNHWLQLQKATAQEPGPYQLEWSGRDAAGKIATPEGLYTIEVTATETAGRGERTVRRGNLLVYE